MSSILTNKEYQNLLTELKSKVKAAQFKAALSVNREVLQLYWYIGKQIMEKQKQSSWGSKLLEMLSNDLRHSFPETRGFSVTNLKYMKLFAENYPNGISQQIVDQLPWGHITILLKIKNSLVREWYASQSIEQSWSRDLLIKNMQSQLYDRQKIEKNKASNYTERLPTAQGILAQEILKSPYNLDFLCLHDSAQEREIEQASIHHITKFLLELGKGFAFVGSQVPMALNDNEYFIDMLFYHLKLRCYVVIELKATTFKPEHAGQLNFYLNLVDDFLKLPEDNPTIGLLLCKSKDQFLAEYSLKGIQKPIGVSEYQLTKAIPENLKISLPTIEELESELS